jgi:hypothetical protein
VPVIGFPAHFLWTFGSAPWQEKPLQWMPGGLVPVYMLVIFTVVPAGLFVGTRDLCRKIASPIARGMLGGPVAMLWCDTVLISVPNIGIYPSYPSVLIANAITKDDAWGRSAWIWVLVLNAVLWTGIGIAAALLRGRKSPATR